MIENSKIQENKFASFSMRLLAHNIDLLFVLVPSYFIGEFIESTNLLYGIVLIYYMLFQVGFEVSPWAATPGKRMIKIKVIGKDLKSIGILKSFFRNSLKFVSLGILFIGFFMIFFTKKKQGLHDIICNTLVLTK